MFDWPALLRKPNGPDDAALDRWFVRIADRMLNAARLVVSGQPHRLVEVEFYYHAAGHLDPFSHRDSLQRTCGRWYFHRTHGVYRGGSFKGIDLTFGDAGAFGGILIRGLEAPDGTLIDGPSLCVDRLLALCQVKSVAALDAVMAEKLAWDPTNPLYLREDDAEARPVYRSARVGLTLRRAGASEMPAFVLRPYRFLTEPRRTAKGKGLLVLALHAGGLGVEEIRQLTGSPAASIRRSVAAFEAGRGVADFAGYRGRDLSHADLNRLHGTWHTVYRSDKENRLTDGDS